MFLTISVKDEQTKVIHGGAMEGYQTQDRTLLSYNPGQVVPLSPANIIWCWRNKWKGKIILETYGLPPIGVIMLWAP